METRRFSSSRPVIGNEPENSLLSFEEVEDRIHQLVGENTCLRNTLQQNNTYMRQLSVSLIEWQEEVVRVQKSYSLKFEKARDLIHTLKEENSELERKLQLQPAAINIPETLSTFLSDETNHSQKGSSNFKPSSFSPVSVSSFNFVEVPNEDRPIYCPESEDSFLIIREPDEIENNTKKLMKPEKNSENEEEIEKLQQANLKLMQDIVKLEEKLSSCNTCLTKAEEIALKKQSRITELEINTTLLEKQLETLPILNAQIELYKTDFEAERDARQNLAGEKETLAQELRLLKRKLIATDQAAVATPVAAAAASLVEQEDVNSYSCPKCNFNFSSMDSLNNHLDVCLNQQMFP